MTPSINTMRQGVSRSAPSSANCAKLSAVVWPNANPRSVPCGVTPGSGTGAAGRGAVSAPTGAPRVAICAAMRPRPSVTPPVSRNQRASVSAASAAVSTRTDCPTSAPSARQIRPAALRSIRMSAEVRVSTGRAPQSIAKPNLLGRSGASSLESARASACATRWLSSPSCQNGVTVILRRASAARSASTRPISRSPSTNAAWLSVVTPRSCRFARADKSIIPLPCLRASVATRRIWSGLSRPIGTRSRTTSPSPDIIGRSAPGHQPKTCGALMRGCLIRQGQSCGATSKAPPGAAHQTARAMQQALAGWRPA